MKKFLSLTLAVIMTVSCVFVSAQSASAKRNRSCICKNVKAELYASNQVTVSWKKSQVQEVTKFMKKLVANIKRLKLFQRTVQLHIEKKFQRVNTYICCKSIQKG